MARSAPKQPYDIILLGEYRVGKTHLFKSLSGLGDSPCDQWLATHSITLEEGGAQEKIEVQIISLLLNIKQTQL